MNDLARLARELTQALSAAQQNDYAAQALQGIVPMFAVAMAHTYRQLLLLALDEELKTARR